MSSHNRRGSNRKRVVLSAEVLEDRTVPAGNVTAFVSGGVLHVWGDSENNRVMIAGAGKDAAIIVPFDNTTINGARIPQGFEGIKFAYDVQMRDGHDFVYVVGTTGSAGLFVQMSNGNDGLAVDNAQHTGANVILTGMGNDVVSVGMGEMNWAAFDLGGDDDRLVIGGTWFGEVIFNGSGGTDSISMFAMQIENAHGLIAFENAFSSLMPNAQNDTANVGRGGSVTINVAANDQALVGILDPSTIQITSQPREGTVRVNPNGTVTYTNDSGSTGARDSFRYTIRSSTGAVSNEATVTLILPGDNAGPVPAITTTAGDATNLSLIPFRITFNENVTGFDAADVTVTNGTLSNFLAVDARTFTFDVTPTADGTVTVSVAAGAAKDSNNKDSSAATKSITVDRVDPTVAMTTSATNPTSLATIPITVVFSESVTGFTASDLVVSGATVSGFTGSGANYSFNVTPTADGTITIDIPADVATDAAGNGNEAAVQLTFVSDRSAPSLALTTTAGSLTNLATIPITATFSKGVTGFTENDIVVTNGSVINFQGTGDTYTFDVMPTADGEVTVNVGAGVATDAAGNGNTAAPELVITSDRTPPTVVVVTNETSPTSANPIPFTVTFSEEVTDFTAGDVLVNNGAVTNFSGSGTTYTFGVVPNASNVEVSVSVPAGSAEDAATNGNTVSNTVTLTFNGTVVTSALTSGAAADPTNLAVVPMTVQFGANVTGFTADDISVINGTVSNFVAVDGDTYTFNVTPTADGPVVVNIPAGAGTGPDNTPTSAANLTFTSDRTGPVPTIATTATNPTNLAVIPFTVQFDESVTGFTEADVTVTNGTISNFQGSGASYSFNVTPTADGVVTVSIPAGAVKDAVGNDSSADSESVTSDRTAPTATVSSTVSGSTATYPIPYTITFSESVTGFVAADVTVTNGTISNFQGSGTTYTFDVTPTAAGNVVVSVAAGVAADAAGNTNAASNTLTVSFTGTVTTTTISTTATSPTNLATIPFTVTFSESVTGFVAGDITVTNGTVSNFQGSGATYTFDVTPTADGDVTVSVPAGVATGSGGPNTAATPVTVTSDRAAPTTTISTTATSPTNLATIPFTVTFSENVTGFVAGDITVTNGTVSNFQGSGTTYTFDVTPTANGDVVVSVAAGVAQDGVGNNNTAATPVTIASDRTAPTVAITTTATNPSAQLTIPFTVTFSESVTGFAAGDITVTNGTVSNFEGSGTTYTFTFTPVSDGPCTLNIAAGVATDAAGNQNTAAPEFTFTSIRTDAGMTSTIPNINAPEWQAVGSEGLKSWVIQTGTGTPVTASSTITVFYTGWLLNGTVFDQARTTGLPATFPLSNLIPGWKQGLLGMQPGGILRLYIPAALAYGSTGSGSVPPNSDLVFELKLVFTT